MWERKKLRAAQEGEEAGGGAVVIAGEGIKNGGKLEQAGELEMSPYETEGQWDFPYAWAPTQLMAIEGMRKYGFNSDADRISYKFISMVAENFRHDGTIREKYNAIS